MVKVRGNRNSKPAEGYLCPRGHTAIGQMYDPDRMKDPKFVPISRAEVRSYEDRPFEHHIFYCRDRVDDPAPLELRDK